MFPRFVPFALLTATGCAGDGTPISPLQHYPYDCFDDTSAGIDATKDDDTGDPGADPVVPKEIYATYYGTTYAELNVAWFQWILSQPRIGNPGFDPTGAYCASGQSGDVWFLAGSFDERVVERTCTIPSGRAILVPILNVFTHCYLEDEDCTAESLGPELDVYLNGFTGMYATVDGADMRDPADYRVDAAEFSVELPDGNLFQAYEIPITGLVDGLYGGGYWMLFDPLPAGEHTIAFGGLFPDGFANNNTYTLTVE
jgi:hypothetical protein